MNEEMKNDLERIREQLEGNDDWFEKELNEAKRLIGQAPNAPQNTHHMAAKAVPVYNTTLGKDQKEIIFREDTPEEPPLPRKGTDKLARLVVLELLGILGVAAYWVLVILK